MSRLPVKLTDEPAFLFQNFKGYSAYQDITTLSFDMLIRGSQNCSVPLFDRIVPDLGKSMLGQDFDENVGHIGNYTKFKNSSGIEVEVKVYPSQDTDKRDVISIGFVNPYILVVNGLYATGEQLIGQSSGATAEVVEGFNDIISITNIEGVFEVGETILGVQSNVTTQVTGYNGFLFYPITESVNPLPRGRHEYYFDEWFDTNLDPSQSKRLPRLIWTNGYIETNNTPNTGEIYSWTGGIATIIEINGNILAIEPNKSWRSLGFTENASGDVVIVVNGVSYTITDPNDIDTNEITVSDASLLSVGDIVTSQIEIDPSPIPFNVSQMNKKGYMMYGNWNQKSFYQANAFNRPSTNRIISFAGGNLNDLIIPPTSIFTGTGSPIFYIAIDSVTPGIDVEQVTFTSPRGGTNGASFDTSLYSGGIEENIYRIDIVSDMILTRQAGSQTGIFEAWETIIGGTTGAIGQIIPTDFDGADATGLTIALIPGSLPFISGEGITGQNSGATMTLFAAQFQNTARFYKNGVNYRPVEANTPTDLYSYVIGIPNNPYELIDDIFITWPFDPDTNLVYTYSYQVDASIELTIQRQDEEPDTFKWWIDDGAATTLIPIQENTTFNLAQGIQIQFGAETGHTVGDQWAIQADQSIERAWANFYYTLPIRKPGEGYIYQLPSSFWTMKVQEGEMYINTSNGEWGIVSTVLSSDLQSETVLYTPLKQAQTSKVLFPYLIKNIADRLLFVSEDRNLLTLGREQDFSTPQVRSISDSIKDEFQASSFKGGRIQYYDDKVYITSPDNTIMHCYDIERRVWQPPKTFSEMGLLSVVDNILITHSPTRNQSFTMFTNSGGDAITSGQNQAYEVIMRSPYTPLTSRWQLKNSNISFIEGYIDGNPKLIFTAYADINGCRGVYSHDVDPQVCISDTKAPFGQGEFGSHPFGSDPSNPINYFQEMYKDFKTMPEYYFLSLELKCNAKSHTYSILSMGMNAMESLKGNNKTLNVNNLPSNL